MSSAIDILLATYNGAHYLEEQLESIFAQSFTDWRLIIRDDGSTDATLAILGKYTQRYPNKIQLLQDELGNLGILGNFSVLMQQSSATYIMFCDQDDIWLPHKLDTSWRLMSITAQNHPQLPILLHTDLQVIDHQAQLLDKSLMHFQHMYPHLDSFNRLVMQNCITGSSMMINRTLLKHALPLPKQCIMHDWWLGLVAAAFGKIAFLDSATVSYRQHPQNDTGAKHWSWQYIYGKILDAYSITPTQVQAAAFLSNFATQLSVEQQEALVAFINIHTQPWWRKRIQLIRYGLFKQGLIRNLGLLCRI